MQSIAQNKVLEYVFITGDAETSSVWLRIETIYLVLDTLYFQRDFSVVAALLLSKWLGASVG